MKKYIISDYQIIDYGIENSQYFSGITTYNTDYDFCIYDVAESQSEAFKNVINRIYEQHGNIEIDYNLLNNELKTMSDEVEQELITDNELSNDCSDLYYHIGLLYNLTEVK